jgi:hypothetical protein
MSQQERGARSVAEFLQWAGIGKTQFYKEVKVGRLKVVKVGTKTLVPDESGKAWLASLPEGVLKTSSSRKGRTASEDSKSEAA